jgi:hypothetical protein
MLTGVFLITIVMSLTNFGKNFGSYFRHLAGITFLLTVAVCFQLPSARMTLSACQLRSFEIFVQFNAWAVYVGWQGSAFGRYSSLLGGYLPSFNWMY